MTIIIAAGGTGGHIFPAQAVAEMLRSHGQRAVFVTDKRYFRYQPTAKPGTDLVVLCAVQLSKQPLKLLRAVLLNGIAAIQALWLIWRIRPQAVIGFGGYPALPMLLAALLTRTPLYVHEQNAVLGKTNRLFVKYAQALFTGLPQCKHVPNGVTSLHVGVPVRQAFIAEREQQFVAPDAAINLLVIGGSQGAAIFDKLIPEAIALLPAELCARLHITEQAATAKHAEIAAHYAACGVRHQLSHFFTDMPAQLAKAHLVIARAGASSLAEITAVGRASILIPYPYAIFDHQLLNAEALVHAGAAECIAQKDLTAELLAAIITGLLSDPAKLVATAQNARALGQPEAAALVCARVTG